MLDVKQAQHDYAKGLVLFEEQTRAKERMMNGMRATFRKVVLENCAMVEAYDLALKLEVEELVDEYKENAENKKAQKITK